jgi:putative ABC transport system permease protein
MPGAGRAVGSAGRGTLALGVLVCGCVFAAVAGPALNLHTRTQALQQDMATLGAPTKSVQMSAFWSDYAGGNPPSYLTAAQLSASTRQIARGLAATPLPLARGDWVGLSTKTVPVASPVPASAMADGATSRPQLEVVYRDPFTSNARVVAGTYSTAGVPAGAVPVAVTTQTAARFGLHPGSRIQLSALGSVELDVTAIVAERDADSTFWTQDTTVGTPSFVTPGNYWAGGVLADPGALRAVQASFAQLGLLMQWEFPLGLGGVNADQVQGLVHDLQRAQDVLLSVPALTAQPFAPTVSAPVAQDLSAFVDTQAATQTVLLLLFVSMIVVGIAVILVASLTIAVRRGGELAVLRSRGGSLWQVAGLMLRGSAAACVPAALAGAGLVLVLVPGTPGQAQSVSWVLGWVLAGTTVLAALAGPPLIAVWRHRQPAPAVNPARVTAAETRSRVASLRRPVAEVTACAASVAGLVVLHDEGVPAGGSVDWFLAAAPVLVAVLAVVVMLRLYPLVIRGLLRLSARRAGATGFVALAGAARTSLTGVLPAFALVLALSVATFAGTLRNAIGSGEVAASWQATGADVMITTGSAVAPATPAAVRAIAAVPGVRHVAAVWVSTWVTSSGQPLTVVAVDPASYQAVVAGTPFPAVPVSGISVTSGRSPATTVPVLASPAEAAALGREVTRITSMYQQSHVSVRIVGEVASTPAQPTGGAFLIVPQQGLTGLGSLAADNMVLVTGASINDARLSAVVANQMPAALIRFRSAVLSGLVNSPLQHGAVLVVTLTIAAATGFGLFILVLGLALGSADSELMLARLTVMGHERPTWLVLAEVMPAVLAAVVAGAVCGLVLPHLMGSSLDLSGFTGATIPVQLKPDPIALALLAAFFLLIAAVTLVTETRALRRRGVTGMLRAN